MQVKYVAPSKSQLKHVAHKAEKYMNMCSGVEEAVSRVSNYRKMTARCECYVSIDGGEHRIDEAREYVNNFFQLNNIQNEKNFKCVLWCNSDWIGTWVGLPELLPHI